MCTLYLVLIWFNTGGRLLLDAIGGGLILSSGKALDFHTKIGLLLAIFKNIYRLVKTINNLECHDLQNDFYHTDK